MSFDNNLVEAANMELIREDALALECTLMIVRNSSLIYPKLYLIILKIQARESIHSGYHP